MTTYTQKKNPTHEHQAPYFFLFKSPSFSSYFSFFLFCISCLVCCVVTQKTSPSPTPSSPPLTSPQKAIEALLLRPRSDKEQHLLQKATALPMTTPLYSPKPGQNTVSSQIYRCMRILCSETSVVRLLCSSLGVFHPSRVIQAHSAISRKIFFKGLFGVVQ